MEPLRSNTAARLEVPLPPGSAGRWCLIRVQATAAGAWWAGFALADHSRGHVVRQGFLGPLKSGWRATLIHVPAGADHLDLRLFGERVAPGAILVRALGRQEVAGRLLAHGWRLLQRAMSGGVTGMPGRIRALLGQAPARSGEAPPYAMWCELYEPRGDPARAALLKALDDANPGDIQVVVLDPYGNRQALDQTLAALDRQWLAPDRPTAVVTSAGGWPTPDRRWVVILEAGEVPAPQALAQLAVTIEARPDLLFLCADTDRLDSGGVRSAPAFKPRPGPVLLASGLLTTGLCAVRRDSVRWGDLPLLGDAARQALALRLATETPAGLAKMHRVPAILTHLSPGREHSSPALLPPRLPARGRAPAITVIVPSAARAPHVLRSVHAVSVGTDYPSLEILVAVSRVDPADRKQAAILRRLGQLPRTRVVDLALEVFNYAEVNNRAAAYGSGECLLLLNDDVTPIEPGWLRRMASLLDERIGIVGARLLYGNGMLQHGGVIMGLAELCEHDGKFSELSGLGPHHPAPRWTSVNRDVSAVTAACMLVKSGLYRDLGGLDTGFAIALNDVDFCLRARASGAGIAFCAEATLFHQESLSLRRHYEGARAGLEGVEVQRLRARWQSVIDGDPFYNPQASTEPGREWQPAFPPRHCVT